MFSHHLGKSFSLMDVCSDLMEEYELGITKQAIDDRFNDRAVLFFRRILDQLLSAEFNTCKDFGGLLSRFNRVRIKDSTKFPLPKAFTHKYKGHGGGGNGGKSDNCESLISIQYEYDMLSGETMDLRLTDGLKNDLSDSRDFTDDIRENDLFIRDLGYCSLPYLEKIAGGGAFFLNRLPAKTVVYTAEDGCEQMDFKKIYAIMKKRNLSHMELNVLVGKKAKLPCRLVIMPVDNATYEKRIRKATEKGKHYKYKVSQEYRAKSRLNFFITNVDKKDLDTEKVREVYTLRWQLELLFKVWKSQAKIDQIKEMKIERFECQLYSKLIWLLLNWRIFKWMGNEIYKRERKLCSVWKFYKYATRIAQRLRMALKDPVQMEKILIRVLKIAPMEFILEKKKDKLSQNQTFKHLA
tara:strand:+ start:348 stop:1574 length:1227 start_codon:yes stop_codon:yes gene_type:complete